MSNNEVIVNDHMNDNLHGMILDPLATKQYNSSKGRVTIMANVNYWSIQFPDGSTERSVNIKNSSTDANIALAENVATLRVGSIVKTSTEPLAEEEEG